jgi:hypothetical protein
MSHASVSALDIQTESACVIVSVSVSMAVCQCPPGDRVSVQSGDRQAGRPSGRPASLRLIFALFYL